MTLLDHVTVTVTAADLAASLEFYDVVLAALGAVRIAELVDEEEDDADVESVGWGLPDGPAVLWVVAGARPTTGLHLRLHADSRAQVEAFHAAAVAAGADVHSPSRRWAIYRRGEVNAIVVDPAGNLVEAFGAE